MAVKAIIKRVLINTLALVIIGLIAPGLSYGSNGRILILSAFILSLLNSFIKPLLKIMLLPLNIITLGLAGWFVHAIILYLLTLIVPGLTISGFTLNLLITRIVLNQLMAYIVISFLINIATGIISWSIDHDRP